MSKITLKVLPDGEIENLMCVLEHKFPCSSPVSIADPGSCLSCHVCLPQVYYWLRTHRRWQGKVPGLQLQVLCPAGDWTRGAVVAISSGDQHLDAAGRLWRHNGPIFAPLLSAMVRHNRSCGVFLPELASMALETEYGGVGLLQTAPEHARRGLASLALASLTRDLGMAGISPHLFVVTGNQTSLDLVAKLGYRHVGSCSTLLLGGFQHKQSR